MKSGLFHLISVAACSLWLALGASTLAHAERVVDEYGRAIPIRPGPDPASEPQWKEQSRDLPPYPGADGLHGGELSVPGSDFTFQLDTGSLVIGDDGVVSYSIVISSPSGARNVFFEGIRCQTGEYKTYAYGSQGEWHTAAFSQWQTVEWVRGSPHRRELYRYYLCDEYRSPLNREQIAARLDTPSRFNERRP